MDFQTQYDKTSQQITEQGRALSIGEVVTVTERTEPSDDWNHYVNVILRDGNKELRRVPIVATHNGEAIVPRAREQTGDGYTPGDLVVVEFLGGHGNAPVITGIIHSDTAHSRAPLAREGHWRQQFGANEQLFVEAEPVDHSAGHAEVIRLAKKSDGLSDPTTAIEIDDSGSTTQVNIETDGDIHLSAGGNIVIDEGGTAKPVATKDHTHSVTLSDGSTSTTSKPDDTTNTKIE